MTKIDKTKKTELTKEKKEILRSMSGKYSVPVDLNKVKDWVKAGCNG